jgi:hypothetical protein
MTETTSMPINKLLEGKDFINILEFSDNTEDNEYLQQALDFLKNTNSEIQIKYDGFKVRDIFNDNIPRDNYVVTLKNSEGRYDFTFTNSIAHSRFTKQVGHGMLNPSFKVPNAYDILACLSIMSFDSVDDYISEFGIEINPAQDFRNAEKTFNLIQQEEISLLRMYTSEEIEQLRDIN